MAKSKKAEAKVEAKELDEEVVISTSPIIRKKLVIQSKEKTAEEKTAEDKVIDTDGTELETSSPTAEKALAIQNALAEMEAKTENFVHTSSSPRAAWEIESYIKSLNSHAQVSVVEFSKRQCHFRVVLEGKAANFPSSGHYTVRS